MNQIEEKQIKTGNRNNTFLIVILSAVILALAFFLFRNFFKTRIVDASIPRTEIYLNQPLQYVDNTLDAKKWKWEFGNGDTSQKKSGLYYFREKGYYNIRLTVDGSPELSKGFQIIVNDTVALSKDSVRIVGDKIGVVGHLVRFSAFGNEPDEVLTWDFGAPDDVGNNMLAGQTVFHNYKFPGQYIVRLTSNKTNFPIIHAIKIRDTLTALPQVVEPAGMVKGRSENDFKRCLQTMINSPNNVDLYNYYFDYLKSTYLLNNGNVPVTYINGGGQQVKAPFSRYCREIVTTTSRMPLILSEVTLTPINDERGPFNAVTVK